MPQTEIEVGTGVAVKDEAAVVASDGMDFQALMVMAIEKDGAIDIFERLRDMRNDEMEKQAERDFGAAFAEFKRLCPAIPRNKKGSRFVDKGGAVSYVMYAPLEGIQAVVDPILNSVGLSYWWSSEADLKTVATTCHLRHVNGHERTAAMVLPVSSPPKASATQGHSGTRTFNKRLTLGDVLGIQTTDDLDGEDAGSADTLTEKQQATIRDLLEAGGGSLDTLLHFAKVGALELVTQDKYDTIVGTLKAKIAKGAAT